MAAYAIVRAKCIKYGKENIYNIKVSLYLTVGRSIGRLEKGKCPCLTIRERKANPTAGWFGYFLKRHSVNKL